MDARRARLRSEILLLLVTALIGSAFKTEDVNVRLEPTGTITVREGSSLKINCTFRKTGKPKVSWHYYKTSGSKNKINTEETSFNIVNDDSWSMLTVPAISTTESAWFFCRVTIDIPVLTQESSDELHVLVEANDESNTSQGVNPTQDPNRNRSTTNSPTTCSPSTATHRPLNVFFDYWWIWIALAVGCVILIVSLVVTWMLSCRTKESIYENTAPKKTGCWRRSRTRMDSCNLPASKKTETIKPLRKYDTLSQNRVRRP